MFRLAVAICAALVSISLARAEPTKIRIAYSSLTGQLTAQMPHMPKEVLRNWGKTYVMEPVFIRGSGPMLTAVAAKEVDFANYGFQSFINGVVEAKLDMMVIEDSLSDKPPYYETGYWVHADSDIRRVEDLKGKVVGVNARGSTNEAALRKMLNDHGLKDGQDYQLVEARFDALLPTLQARRVDLAFLVLPFGLIAEDSGKYRRLFTMRDSLGPAQTVLIGGLAEFVTKNRAALVDYLEDELRMRRWLYDPKNRPEMLAILAKLTKQPAERFADWVFTKRDNYRDINGLVDPKVLQQNVDDLHKLGLTKGTFDVSKHLDMSLVKEAATRIR